MLIMKSKYKITFRGAKAIEVASQFLKPDLDGDIRFDLETILPIPNDLKETFYGSLGWKIADYYLASINPYYPKIEGEKVSRETFKHILSEANKCIYTAYETPLYGCNKGEITEDIIKLMGGKEKTLKIGYKIVNNRINYYASDWSKWCLSSWGTRLNTINTKVKYGIAEVEITCETVSPVGTCMELISKIIREKDIEFRLEQSLGDIDNNVEALFVFKNGEMIKSYNYYNVEGQEHWLMFHPEQKKNYIYDPVTKKYILKT